MLLAGGTARLSTVAALMGIIVSHGVPEIEIYIYVYICMHELYKD